VMEGYPKSDEKNKLAIKIMSKKSKVNEMLYNHEVDILKQLDHSNILNFIDSFEDPSNFYVLTELCRGGELFDRIVDKDFEFTERLASKYVRTMLSSLKHCHDRNIVHRDLKPENFVFKSRANDAEIVLIDFGCAKTVNDDQEYKDLVGTPYYLAPESARASTRRFGKTLKSSDIWSIGVIAYVMLTGRPPFNGKSNPDIFRAILQQKLKFPRDTKLSESFQTFVRSVLKKGWEQRPTVEEALANPWIKGEGATSTAMNQEVIRCLCQFQYQTRLKKAITKSLAQNMGDQPRAKIQEHFNRLDSNRDGNLDADELKELLLDMNQEGYAGPEEAQQEAEKIIQQADKDGDGEIGFDEFAQVWQRKLLSVNTKYAQAVFDVLDHNKDGFIDKEELRSVLQMDDSDMVEIAHMIAEVDINGDGQISFKEFEAAMKEDIGDTGKPAVGVGKINIENVDNTNLVDMGLAE